MGEVDKVYTGDCMEIMKSFPENWVQTVITSPPYWGLRDYGLEPIVWDGDPECQHEWESNDRKLHSGSTASDKAISVGGAFHGDKAVSSSFCIHCGAWLGCLGLEPTPELYVAHLVQVFAEVKRVLKGDGTLWLNIGDSYAANKTGSTGGCSTLGGGKTTQEMAGNRPDKIANGLKPKDMVMIPFRLALALQADGWWVRSDIIWHKNNCMPSSVKDRPTTDFEHVFLLAKSKKYYYDGGAIMEQATSQKSSGFTLANTAGRTDSAPFGSATLRPKFGTALLADDCTSDARGWLDFGKSEIAVNSSVTRDAQRFQVVNLVGFKIRLETPERVYMVDLKEYICSAASGASIAVALKSEFALDWPIETTIPDTTSAPCGAILASVVDGSPLARTFTGAEVVRLECALISGEFFSAHITLDCECGSASLFVWTSLWSSHVGSSVLGDTRSIAHKQGIVKSGAHPQRGTDPHDKRHGTAGVMGFSMGGNYRNKRTVWTVSTRPYKSAHFATFPPKLIEPMILAGSKEGDIVFDPFAGSGTTLAEARRHGRHYCGIEANPEYVTLIEKRIAETPKAQLKLDLGV